MTRDELLQVSIKHITDGWVIENGDLYLWVTCDDGVTRTIRIPVARRQTLLWRLSNIFFRRT